MKNNLYRYDKKMQDMNTRQRKTTAIISVRNTEGHDSDSSRRIKEIDKKLVVI